MTVPVQRMTFGLFTHDKKSELELLREENMRLTTQLAKQQELEKENKALHDQFQIENPKSTSLLPASIIGRKERQLIIDKGTEDQIAVGAIIVYKDNLIGQIVSVSKKQSVVALILDRSTSFTAQDVSTGSLGVIKGKGKETVLLENVLLSDELKKDEVVMTNSDIEEDGTGIPSGLVVGKIISVNKNPSALFQTAEVKSLVDFGKLSTVFVMVQN